MFKKGDPKPVTSGRKKGSINLRTRSVEEIMAKWNYDPLEAMVKLAIESTDDYTRMKCNMELCKYRYPQLKGIEHSGTIENPYMQMSLEQIEALGKKIFGKGK